MGELVFGIILIIVGVAIALAAPRPIPRPLHLVIAVVLCGIGIALAASCGAVYVADNRTGVVIRKFGPDLPANRVVASGGEKGPQAAVLGPGWHFGFWPWVFDVEQVEVANVPAGEVGVVTALDGKGLPADTVYAPRWEQPETMLDGERFLSSPQGFRGPQLTVLAPGVYRFNPRLFSITARKATVVAAGEVAVVKSNAGAAVAPGPETPVVNGTPLVGRDERGIWREPLRPGAYYLHPDAYEVVKVATTNRIYTYQDKRYAIGVRSKDGFTFPVDVRVACSIAAEDAPFLVALLANPDLVRKDDQEDDDLSVLESKVIVPLIRTIFRDVAEGMNALQFVTSRSEVERTATERMRAELARFRLKSDGIFVGNIHLDATDAGKQLILTQTDREVALNQRQMFDEQRRAQESRATLIKAQEEAEQQKLLAAATYQVRIAEQRSAARKAEAQGEADYLVVTAKARQQAYREVAEAIGAEGVTMLEMLKLVAEGKVQITPQVMVGGSAGGGGAGDALAGTILGRMLAQPATATQPAAAPAPAAPPQPAPGPAPARR